MKLSARNNNQSGFTLIELLVVIGILAVLMGIVLVAINPARQFNQANDANRANSVRQILNALGAYAADNKGALPAGIPATAVDQASSVDIASGIGNADLCSALIPTYISALPEDPTINNGAAITSCASYDSGFNISKDASGRITIYATHAAFGPISVTR